MENELKTDFDVIVLGTGFVESLVAAAAARIGKKVLHLDRNGFYGGQWASFSLSSLQEWVEKLSDKEIPSSTAASDCLDEGEALCALTLPYSLYFGTKHNWHVQEKPETDSSTTDEKKPENTSESDKESSSVASIPVLWSKEELEKLNRKFNIDLAPKILFSRGALVELLISSNVARYVEFKCITRVLTWVEGEADNQTGDGKLVNVPCSRSDVFTTDVINLIEKRLLMKFLEFCYSYEQNREEWADYADKSFKEFLVSRNLTPKLVHFITSAIGMVEDEVDCTEGLRKTSLFLNSLGRYGTMPFLFTLYGSGEMPQAFCRLCAVFEGVYILRRSVENLVVKDGAFIGVTSEGEKFKGSSLVMDCGYAPLASKATAKRKQSVSRGIIIANKSILANGKEHLTILRMPSTDKSHTAVTVIELGSGCAVCPKDTYLVHLICGGEDAESDLKETSQRLFNFESNEDSEKPNALFSLYFNQMMYDFGNTSFEELPSCVYLCGGPDAALDYDEAIQQAKDIFRKIFPDDEFLPRAPDHNDIVFDNSEEAANSPSDKSTAEDEGRDDTVDALEGETKEMSLLDGKADENDGSQ